MDLIWDDDDEALTEAIGLILLNDNDDDTSDDDDDGVAAVPHLWGSGSRNKLQIYGAPLFISNGLKKKPGAVIEKKTQMVQK
jgi:hypothetical protein